MRLDQIDLKRGDHYENPYPEGFEKVSIPEGESGNCKVKRYTVTREEVGLFNLRLIRDGQYHRIVPPGEYTKLIVGGGIMMTDTPAEAHEHSRLRHFARGNVLMNGLGLGFCLAAILRKVEVTAVTVVEKSADVLALVAPHITDPRVTFVEGDALTWRPAKGVRFDAVWHDIWPTICGDNKPQMATLRRAYGRRTLWQSCWSEEYLR